MKKQITIGNASGFWGDDPSALRRILSGRIRLDYVVSDFLAELSMSILKKLKDRGKVGFPQEALNQIVEALPLLLKKRTVLITNGGGLDPESCARALLSIAEKRGYSISVAVVTGDDCTQDIPRLLKSGEKLFHSERGVSFKPHLASLRTANAYIGAAPIAAALRYKPNIIICGRVTDSALALGPLMHEFGWSTHDYDRLAAGVIAGHLIECGAQSTGGNLTDWRSVRSFSSIGFPIVKCSSDGAIEITKPPGSGGIVSEASIKEQLVYEIFDPQRYETPDVTADVTTLRVKALGAERVRVDSITGRAPPSTLKINLAHSAGFKVSGSIFISGPDAREKAAVFEKLLWERSREALRHAGLPFFERTATESIGDTAALGEHSPSSAPHEILLRFSAADSDREKLSVLRRAVPSLILSGPSGVCATGGAPEVSEIVGYWPTTLPRDVITPRITTLKRSSQTAKWSDVPLADLTTSYSRPYRVIRAISTKSTDSRTREELVTVPLRSLAYGRSGDKGDTANIGIVARTPAIYDLLVRELTPALIKRYFKARCAGKVTRFLLPNLGAINFVLAEALDGGGTQSLRMDAQGKMYAQALLQMEMRVPRGVLGSSSID